MIKGCNDDKLQKKRIDKKYILLYQVWKELTEPKTLDTYQYRMMNTLSGIRELIKVIDQKIEASTSTNHGIDDCKQELAKIVSADDTLKQHYFVIWKILLLHLHEKTDLLTRQKALRYQLEYCYNTIIDQYLNYLLKDIEKDIEESNSEGIIKKTAQLVSCCITIGWTAKALYNLVDIIIDSESDNKKWKAFCERILSNCLKLYSVYIPIKVSPKPIGHSPKEVLVERFHQELRDLGIQIIDKQEMQQIAEDIPSLRPHIEDRHYLLLEVDGIDEYAASRIAISKCSEAMSLLSFFNAIEAWDINDLGWLVYEKVENRYITIKYHHLYSTYDYLEGSLKLIAASKRIMSLDTSIQRKLRAAFSYSNMGRASSAQEEKFINTWVAIESLCRGDTYENIISNVLETVPPALCKRYIYKLFRNFIEDCGRCDVDFSMAAGMLFERTTPKEECVKRIIAAYKDENIYAELLKKCRVNTLLFCRCEELHKLISDTNRLMERVEQHYTNVRWQLSRLYRIRNEIAHNACASEESLLLYIEHLDDYLAGIVAEVVMYSDKKGITDIELVFEMIKDNYHEFIEMKNAKKGAYPIEMLSAFFEKGIIELV